mgnify:CR=1 FL=1
MLLWAVLLLALGSTHAGTCGCCVTDTCATENPGCACFPSGGAVCSNGPAYNTAGCQNVDYCLPGCSYTGNSCNAGNCGCDCCNRCGETAVLIRVVASGNVATYGLGLQTALRYDMASLCAGNDTHKKRRVNPRSPKEPPYGPRVFRLLSRWYVREFVRGSSCDRDV